MDPLQWAARHGPWVLVAGLVAGLALPGLAEPMRPYLSTMVAVMLFVAVLRIAPADLIGSLKDAPKVLATALALQLLAPLVLLCLALLAGVADSVAVFALTLMLAAPSIMGSPNISMMLGANPTQAMRLMVAGTALVPVTILPVFWLSPVLNDASAVRQAALVLLVTITLATTLALIARQMFLRNPTPAQSRRLDGVSAILLAVFVVGLMPQVTLVALQDPLRVALWTLFVFAANFGAQGLVWLWARKRVSRDVALPVSVIAGNRNVALFLVSLPPEITAPVLVFIGCYQLPMYLTPLLMKRLYGAAQG